MKTARESSKQPSTALVRSVIVGTAGHIDHGKTALVLALTGTNTDRLPEEKARGITIDLGFAALEVKDDLGNVFDLSLIDVPGHHAFVRHMLAGAGGIDCVVLVVAADEGVRAQTREHMAICTLLGIPRGLIVLTKKDAVNEERLQQARIEVEHLVQHTFLEGAPVLAVSARTGEGIPDVITALGQLASLVPRRSADAVARLPLDRAFSIRGFGTVVTGTLQAGTMYAGDTLELQPKQAAVRVRGLQVHGLARNVAEAPCRVALNVPAIEVAGVKRGDTLVPTNTLRPVSTVDVELTMLPEAAVPKHRSSVRLHAFTSESVATVLLYDEEGVANTTTRLARLRLTKPMLLVPGDHFVLRQNSPAITLGGGRVLDAHPLPRLRKALAYRWLKQIQEAPAAEQIGARVLRRGVAGISLQELVVETGLTSPAIRKHLAPALAAGQLVGDAGLNNALSSEALGAAMEEIHRELGRAKSHTSSRAELASRTRLSDWVFALALGRLLQAKRIIAQRETLTLPGQAEQAHGTQSPTLTRIETIYREAGLASPIVSDIQTRLGLQARQVHELITVLLRTKRLVRMGADNLLIHCDALARLTSDLQKHRGEQFDVPRFKSFTGLTRKHAIPLLEYLDGTRVTRNVQGTRVIL